MLWEFYRVDVRGTCEEANFSLRYNLVCGLGIGIFKKHCSTKSCLFIEIRVSYLENIVLYHRFQLTRLLDMRNGFHDTFSNKFFTFLTQFEEKQQMNDRSLSTKGRIYVQSLEHSTNVSEIIIK